jgi:hypothetical protein
VTPAIALLLVGAILLKAGFTNRNVVDVMLGREGGDNPKAKVPAGTDFGGGDFGPPGTGGTDGTGGGAIPSATPVGGGSKYIALIAEMNRIAALNLPYRWGGGHAPGYVSPNGPFDCSGAVSYALHAAGLYNGPPLISGAFMAWGKAGKGSTITVYANPTHVFMRDERTGRDWGTTRTVGRGGPQWHHHTTKGFVARHPEGM